MAGHQIIVEMFQSVLWVLQSKTEIDKLTQSYGHICFDLGVRWRHPQAIPTIAKALRMITFQFLFSTHFFLVSNLYYSLTMLLTVDVLLCQLMCPRVFQDEKLDATSRSLRLAALSSSIKGPNTFLSSSLRSDTLCEYLYTEATKPELWQLICWLVWC